MKRIILFFITYLFLFSPSLKILPISILNLMAVGAYIYLLTSKERTNKILFYKKELKILFVIFFYIAVISLITGMKSIEPIVSSFKILFLIFPIAIALTIWIERSTKAEEFHLYFKKNLIYTFLIAGCTSLILFLNPDLNEFIKADILRTLDIDTFQDALLMRGFGLSDSLLYAYPIALGLGACYILENVKNKLLSISLFLILLISILINARIGIVPVIGYFVYLLLLKRKFMIVFLAPILIVLLYNFAENSGWLDQYSYFSEWISSGFDDTLSLFQGSEVSGNYSVLSTMFHIPENLLFGSGDYIFISYFIHSDIGFVLQLYYGGIIYVFLILLFFYVLLMNLKKYLSWRDWFPIIFVITVVFSNLKGNFFSSNPAMHTIVFLYVFTIYYNKQYPKNISK